jgi:c-di-GMP-binding flagellar brake protein YcgR
MKTIIIIESDDVEQEPVADILRQAREEFNLLFARDEKTATIIAEHEDVDLIIYDFSTMKKPQVDNLTRLNTKLPYIPCLAILEDDSDITHAVQSSGVSNILTRPLNPANLHRHTRQQLELASSGQVRGIPIHSLLQMLESDEKTCTLKIQGKGGTGLIFVDKGVVTGAETSDQSDEDAVYSIITWEAAAVEIRYYNRHRPQTIQKPLISLIMEGFRLKDERDSLKQKQESEKKPRLDLKHISTAGNRISLDIGSKLKMEFNELDTPLVSTMVGMIPDEYLIVTTPTPSAIVDTALNADTRIIVKYLHIGRLCMFKTRLLKAITEPHQLLFLDYPPVIHYHELRRAKRTAIFLPCTLHLRKGPEFYGVLVDLSGLGCLCQIKTKGNAPLPNIDINTKVQLRCLLPGMKEDQELTGHVKNLKKSATETRIGIEFTDLQGYLKETIEKYVYSVESIVS